MSRLGLPAKPGQVRVSTSEYQAAHGRHPQGRGHWAFYFGFRRGDLLVAPEFIQGELLYSEARRRAQKAACDRGFTFIEVGS